MDRCFVDQAAIRIKEYRAGFYLGNRVEKRVRRSVFRQAQPECSIVKRLYGFAETVDGLGTVTLSYPGGARPLYLRPRTSDENVTRDVFDLKQYSLEKLARWAGLLELLERSHRAGRRPLIIDAGANIGVSAIFFAMTFPTATVVAIEPEERNYRLLCKNTSGLNIICVRAALSSVAGEVEVFDPGDGPWAFRTQRVERGEALPCRTIASLYAEHLDESSFPFLVKIDIEGGEEDVFRSDTGWVSDTPIVITELHDWMLPGKGSALPFLRCISALDRDFIYCGENIISIDNKALLGDGRVAAAGVAADDAGR